MKVVVYYLPPYPVELGEPCYSHKHIHCKQVVVDWNDHQGIAGPDGPCNQGIIMRLLPVTVIPLEAFAQ